MSYISDVKKASPEDWHPADIVASLRKAGWSLRKLSVSKGLSVNTLKVATQVPYPNGERLIAEAIGVEPFVIWPSRYNEAGLPNRGRRPRNIAKTAIDQRGSQSSEFNAPLQRKS